MLSWLGFCVARTLLFGIDTVAVASFRSCAESCNLTDPPRSTCEALLLAVSWFNGLAVLGFMLVVGIRWFVEERSFDEARCITHLIVTIEILLKCVDVALPLVLTFECFTDSTLPPFDNSMSSCPKSGCLVGDFFAMYGLYSIVKVLVGGLDLVLNSGTMIRKPSDWYRMRRIG